MHEITFIRSIISGIKDREKVNGIFIEVGELSGMEADHLKEHLEELTGWKVNAESRESKVKCKCGYVGKAQIKQRLHDFVIFSCPKCGSIPELLEGKDIKIVKVVYD